MAETDPITRCLVRLEEGDREAVDELLPLIYGDLRALALNAFRGGEGGHTLQPTALVHEAYLRLVDARQGYRGRQHFLAVAALAMRQLLADHARRRGSEKRGGDRDRVEYVDSDMSGDGPPGDTAESYGRGRSKERSTASTWKAPPARRWRSLDLPAQARARCCNSFCRTSMGT